MSPPSPDPLSFLSAFGLTPDAYPGAYWDGIDTLSGSALVQDFYERPRAKVSILEGAHGSKLVRPPGMRLVPESADMARHLAAAAALPSGVQPEFSATAPTDLLAAVRQCVAQGCHIPDWRARQQSLLERVEISLRPFAEVVSAFMSGPAAAIASHVNLPFMAAVVVALRWPDFRCVRRWFYGHEIVGNIPDTGLFRPHLVDFAAPPSTFMPPSNRIWNRHLEKSLAASGAKAESDDGERALLVGVEAATRKETAAGVVHGPFTAAQLHSRFGRHHWRGMRRFGVEQGVDDDGLPKVRAIDNAAANRGNDATRTHETIAPPSFAFVALVGRLFLAASSTLETPMPALSFGLDDMARAYRQIPVSTPQFTVFGIWSVSRRRVEFYYLHGHNFGFRSSVLNFNAFPHLVCAVARVFLAVPVDHFFDDFLVVDSRYGGDSGQLGLGASLRLFGQSHEPKKRKPVANSNIGLGVSIDVSAAQSALVIHAAAVPDRVSRILTSLQACARQDYMSPAMASSVRGKLGFVFGTCYFRFAMASLQPLMQREFFDSSYEWSPPLQHMFEFLLYVMPILPPLAMSLRPSSVPPLIVYTDAMFTPRVPHPLLRIGWLVYDPISRAARHSHLELPPSYFHLFEPGRRTYIYQGEGIGAVAPALSAPHMFRGPTAMLYSSMTTPGRCPRSSMVTRPSRTCAAS